MALSDQVSLLASRVATEAKSLWAALESKADGAHGHDVTDLTATGTPSETTYLRGDGAWATPEGGGGGSGPDAVAMPREDKLYLLTEFENNSVFVIEADRIELTPIPLVAPLAIKRLVVAVKTAATAPTSVEIGMYGSDGTLLFSGLVDVASTGNKTVVLPSTVTIPAGVSFGAVKLREASANGAILHRAGLSAQIPYAIVGNSWDALQNSYRGLQVAHPGTGAMPASIASLQLTMGGTSYAFAYRVA